MTPAELRAAVALVELHDARIGYVRVDIGRGGCVHFEHLDVFVRKGDDLYDVWSCGADLCMEGISLTSISGEQPLDAYVSEGACHDSAGNDVAIEALLRAEPTARRLRLVLSGDVSIDLRFARAWIERLTFESKLEEWSGPLEHTP